MLLILEYIVVASLVVFCSIKASKYIDMLDKTTRLSGAFLGGVMLSAVTSLPELFTSISATLLIGKPSLCLSNILGSNIFNMAMLALATLTTIKHFARAKISKGNIWVTLAVLMIYIVLLLNMFNLLNFELATVNIVSLVIVLLYAFGVRYLAGEEGCVDEECSESIRLSTRQIVLRFILSSVAIIVLSILMTYVTDDIATEFNIGSGLAGALFLGVATSLPEVSSTVMLVRMRNFNIAVGNIVGSNLFNFTILCVADVLALQQNIYDFADAKVVGLLEFGLFATLALLPMLYLRKRWEKLVTAVVVILCYVAFLVQ
jgi:cation:H+ antiporter